MTFQGIKALVVDDSNFMITVVSDILKKDSRIDVIGIGKNGEEAVRLNKEKDPDVILMDIEMPKMGGLAATRKIMSEDPTPIVILSAMGDKQADMSVKALDAGAVDYIAKTSGSLSMDIRKKSDIIVNKIVNAAKNGMNTTDEYEPTRRTLEPRLESDHIVVIGSSTGGTRALDSLLSILPENFPYPIVVVQHMPPKFTAHLASTLDSKMSIKVVESEDHQRLEEGRVYIIKAGNHGVIKSWENKRFISLNDDPELHGVRPSADYLLQSASKRYKDKAVGIILTGMGKDGALGAKMIKEKGGFIALQDEDSCVVYGMPKAAKNMAGFDFEGAPREIAEKLIELFMEVV